MVVHEDPCVDGSLGFSDVLSESLKEPGLVLIVFENGGSVDAPNHDVVQGSRNV